MTRKGTDSKKKLKLTRMTDMSWSRQDYRIEKMKEDPF